MTVTKNGRDGQGMIKSTDMELEAVAKNGMELSIVMDKGSFYAMSANGMMRKLSRADLREIDLTPGPAAT